MNTTEAGEVSLRPWSIDNDASNALCLTVGFEFPQEEDFEYPKGHPIRVNAWLFDLSLLRTRRTGDDES